MNPRAVQPLETLATARQHFYATSGLSASRDQTGRWWRCQLGPLPLVFPNFRWRRRAIQHHDLHHVVTGYPCSVAGELQIAAWEFAAGRFPHIGATLFCLPLILAGAVLLPRRAFAAFRRGRRSRSLYGEPLTAKLLATQLSTLHRAMLPEELPASWSGDRLAWLRLVLMAAFLCLTPILLVAAVLA